MKKLSFIMAVLFVLNIGIISFAQEPISYNENDISILKNILNETPNNRNILNWDIETPNSIDEIEWTKIGDEYYLSSIDLSNLSINGDINLISCLYLENCDFSNTDINSVQLPCSLTNISNISFENCSKLQVVTINADNTIVGSSTFSGCISLKSVVNAEKIISISRNAFNNCENLNFYFSDGYSNSYIENYVQQYNFNIINSVNTIAYGYVGRMNDYRITKFDLNQISLPYTSGTISLYTFDKQLIKTIDIDETGKFSLDNLTLGTKYRIVIDGETAIPREEYFVPITQNYCITPNAECFGVIVCDYNRDGIVSSCDAQRFLEGFHHDSSDENFDFSIYDFNGDGRCNAVDTAVFSNFSYIDYHSFNYS